MDSETDSSVSNFDDSDEDLVMMSNSGSVVITSSLLRRPEGGPSPLPIVASSSSSSSPPHMTTEELLVFSKLEGKIKLKNFHLSYLKKVPEDPLKTNLACETNATGTTLADKIVKFNITITIGSPLAMDLLSFRTSSSSCSNPRPHSPLFDPIDDELVSDFLKTCKDFARTTRSLVALLDFIDSYLERTGDGDDDENPTSPVSDILRELQISSGGEVVDNTEDGSESDIIPSSGSTASRRSSRSTTPTMSDRID